MRFVWLVIVAACGRTGFDPDLDAATGSADARSADAAAPAGNIVFTTSSSHDGALGGLAGADAICAQRASEAGLAGTYIALLSTSTTNAIDRLDGSRGWQRVDGKPVIDLPSQLTGLRAWYPIALDESGNDVRVNTTQVWTGTNPDGTAASDTCSDWQTVNGYAGSVGVDESGAANLTSTNFSDGCSALHRLYCFGTGNHPVSPPTPTVGRLAFLSDETWTPAGTGAADAICQSEAAAAGRSGTFLAALGAASSAESRYVTGAPWVRADGKCCSANTPSELFAGSLFALHTSR